jgi:ABC-type Mn2+/Zn2+ transport system ATPase subunit
MATGSCIEFTDLHIRLGKRHLVRGLSGVVEPGEFLALAGPSGSGKTTLLQVMAGFMEPSGGQIRWDAGDTGRAGRIGFVYQHLRLARQLSALKTVCTGKLGRMGTLQSAFGFSRSIQAGAYEELCHLGLRDYAHSPIGRLSGGERQRVAMARTLFQQQEIYFVDEPVANLDRANAQLVLSRLSRESREAGRTVVAVLHDDSQISLFADRVLRWDGKVEACWKFERIRDRRS